MKPIKIFLAIVLSIGLLADVSWAKPSSSSSGGSRSSSSSRPSSRPSSSSKPSSKPSSSPKPSSRPNSPSPKPSTKPSTASTPKPSSRPQTAVPSKPSVTPSTKPSSRPSTIVDTKPSANPNSSKPTKSFDKAASLEQKKVESRTAFKAATQPKSTYTTPNGETVKIDPKSPAVDKVRKSVDPKEYASRSTRIENHYHTHYGDRYDYYRSRPYIDVGGGYSPLFWYMMMDWSIDRRAQWMYNNQANMNQQLYQQELAKNAQLRTQVESLKTKGAPDPNYVDPEFKDNPDLQYSDEFVAAAYNPESETSNMGLIFLYILYGLVLVGLLVGAYFLVFRANFFKD